MMTTKMAAVTMTQITMTIAATLTPMANETRKAIQNDTITLVKFQLLIHKQCDFTYLQERDLPS